jgi:hypothetical protein
MGYGSYDNSAHEALTTRQASLPQEEVFTATGLRPEMDPKGVIRESRDSANHPNSTGIMFLLDETGSMGDIPPSLAQRILPNFMRIITEGGFIPDPQPLFGAIGDAATGREKAPLQIGQFESEAEAMNKWLTAIYLENNGGGSGEESYDLGIYFAARHTAMDCWEKRGRKGYLFITGDENPYSVVSKSQVERLIGDKLQSDIPIADIVKEAGKLFNIFFLIPDRGRAERCERAWRNLLGDNTITMETSDDTCEVAATLIGLTEGTFADIDAAATKLEELGTAKNQIARIIRAVTPYAAVIGRGGQKRSVDEQGFPASGKGKKGKKSGRSG